MDKKDTIEDKIPSENRLVLGGIIKTAGMGLPIFLTAAGIMVALVTYNFYETKSLLNSEYQNCTSIEDKTKINETSLGEYSCQEIEERYNKLFSE